MHHNAATSLLGNSAIIKPNIFLFPSKAVGRSMKILLWKHGIDDGTTGELPHSGLGVLAGEMKSLGHIPLIIDNHFDPENRDLALASLSDFAPDILCISLVSQEWLLPTVQSIIDAAVIQNIPVWIGGPHTYGYWDLLANDERLTKIIVGEADGQFPTILNSTSKVVHLGRSDKLSAPDFTCLNNHRKMITYPVFTSRGCKYNCSFCAATKTHGNKWRARNLGQGFWQEIDNIAIHFPNVDHISIIDDAFTTDLDHAKSFLKEYIARNYPYRLSVFNVRADQIDFELLQLLKATRVETLSVGIESGDREVFRMVKKGEDLKEIEKAIKLIQSAGIMPWLNMVIGLPGDSPAAHKRSMAWVEKIPKPYVVQWLHFAPYRNTWAYNYFIDRGDIADGFIPWLQGGRYEELPENGIFDSCDFSREQKMLAQLEGYLKNLSPILILNYEEIKKICGENDMMELLQEWKTRAPIADFINITLPKKIAKGQIAATCLKLVRDFFD